jgi:Zn-finger nucleic acid-binding protein
MTAKAKCPKCRTQILGEALSSAPDTALSCANCHGLWIPQVEAERLVSGSELTEAPADASSSEGSDLDQKVGMCPAGHSILTRARVDLGNGDSFHLDRCPQCRGIWFDEGEWGRLASARMLHLLGNLWNPIWQKQVRQSEARVAHLERLKERLGADLMGRLEHVASALREHPHRAEALAYLEEEVRLVRAVPAVAEPSPGPDEPQPA